MRICFWSTTFQADTQALAHYLAAQPAHQVTVVAKDPSLVESASTIGVAPQPSIRWLSREGDEARRVLHEDAFDLMIVDNHLPHIRLAPHLLVLWHGFGWRIDDLKKMRRELNHLIGSVENENARFRWQAFGEWDRSYRIRHTGLHPSNVVSLGSAYSDWLRPDSPLVRDFQRTALQPHYTIDLKRPVVLLGPTWHHGGILSASDDTDEVLLRRFVEHVQGLGASVLIRMHDRARHTRRLIAYMDELSRRHPDTLMVKWKDSSPSSLPDLLVSDVCVSNYSSLLNSYYFLERPSIHLRAQSAEATSGHTYAMFAGRAWRRKVKGPEELWKLPPEENGGLVASSADELNAQVERALAEPGCCVSRSRAFIERYIERADGHTCERIGAYLDDWVFSASASAQATSVSVAQTGVAKPLPTSPRASVAVRSYGRLPQLLELLALLLAQDYDDFEVVVIEQSGALAAPYRAQLDELAKDGRLRILRYPPLGAGMARIEAARQSRGEIVVFIDDDDLPLRNDWLREMMRNFDDPLCMGVSGRQVHTADERSNQFDTPRNRRLCLRYSFLRMPRGRVRHGSRVLGVTQVAGGNSAIRASAIARAGGWDKEHDHDEDSFNFRFQRVKRRGEYFAYDPAPVILRRLDIQGGLGRRTQTLSERLRVELLYSHRVVRKYFPARFYTLYPCYLWLAATRATRHVHESQPHRSRRELLLELFQHAPETYYETLRALRTLGATRAEQEET